MKHFYIENEMRSREGYGWYHINTTAALNMIINYLMIIMIVII